MDSRSSSQLDNVFESIRVNNETVVIFTSGIQVKKPFTEPGEPLIKVIENLWHGGSVFPYIGVGRLQATGADQKGR